MVNEILVENDYYLSIRLIVLSLIIIFFVMVSLFLFCLLFCFINIKEVTEVVLLKGVVCFLGV